jgi:2-succinyl-5-enolpyruvyl-6-hydroxy-3-cyclohexene-1-carboxylate synthase
MAARLDNNDTPSEPAVFVDVADVLPDGATLYAGNSMPVRDLDTFFPSGRRTVHFLANRGANGIDGVVSSALGASVASDGPLVLVIGDLSLYHDMNGLLAAKRHDLSATIVLINNDGGGIFSFLPQAEHPEPFEELFGTPHGLDFRAACELYGLGYERAETRRAFREAVARSISSPGVQVIEVRTEREANVALHRAIWRDVSAAMLAGA